MLKLHKPKSDKKVQWDEAVVDNEHMGKKKSKCEWAPVGSATSPSRSRCPPVRSLSAGCCIYAKPHKFGESDSESDSEGDGDCCHEHHVARRRVPRQPDPSPPDTQEP